MSEAWIDCEHCGRLSVWSATHTCQCDTCSVPLAPEEAPRCSGCTARVQAEVQRQYAEMGRQLAALPGAKEREAFFLDALDAQAAEDARAAVMALSRALHVCAQIPGALALVRRALDRAESRVLQERKAAGVKR